MLNCWLTMGVWLPNSAAQKDTWALHQTEVDMTNGPTGTPLNNPLPNVDYTAENAVFRDGELLFYVRDGFELFDKHGNIYYTSTAHSIGNEIEIVPVPGTMGNLGRYTISNNSFSVLPIVLRSGKHHTSSVPAFWALPQQIDGEGDSDFYGVYPPLPTEVSINGEVLSGDVSSAPTLFDCPGLDLNFMNSGGPATEYVLELTSVDPISGAPLSGPPYLSQIGILNASNTYFYKSIGNYGIRFYEQLERGECGNGGVLPVNSPYTVPADLWYDGPYLEDTLNWMPLCWSYQARGDEVFLLLGAFGPLDEIRLSENGRHPYYYVDDVSVTPLPAAVANPITADTVWWCTDNGPAALQTTTAHTSYEWSTGESGPLIQVSEGGWYWVETDLADCTRLRDSVWVEALEPTPLNLGPPEWSVCAQDFPLVLSTGSVLGSFRWSTGETSSRITINEPGAYTVRQLHPCGEFVDSVRISVDAPPPLSLPTDSLVCADAWEAFSLTAPAGYLNYQWQDGTPTPTIYVTQPGTYTLTATHPCTTAVASFTLELLNPPPLPATLDTLVCVGSSLNYQAPTGYASYQWSHGPQTAAVSFTDTGTYQLVASHYCQEATSTIRLQYAPPLAIQFTPPYLDVTLGKEIRPQLQIASGEAVSWQWEPATGLSCTDCPTPILSARAINTYHLTATDRYGCTSSAVLQLSIRQPETLIYAPNAFSPNADGINDRWQLYPGVAVKRITGLQIFNRWGGLVWDSPEARAWPGLVGPQTANTGLYVW